MWANSTYNPTSESVNEAERNPRAMNRAVQRATTAAKNHDQISTFEVPRALKAAAILLILACGLIHLIGAPEHYEEAPYIGALFFANFAAALIAAVGLYRDRLWTGWGLGVLVAGGALVVFLVSRLIGLPAYEEHLGMWLGDSLAEYLGIPSLIVEACFVAAAVVAIPRFRYSRAS
jgi:hypothetical protein